MNETKNREKSGTDVAQPAFRPKLAFYHANSRGTGGAVSMDLHPAHGNKDGCIMMRIANQMTIGNRQGPNPTFPRFDWENAIVVKLGFDDLCQILQDLEVLCTADSTSAGYKDLCIHDILNLSHCLDNFLNLCQGKESCTILVICKEFIHQSG